MRESVAATHSGLVPDIRRGPHDHAAVPAAARAGPALLPAARRLLPLGQAGEGLPHRRAPGAGSRAFRSGSATSCGWWRRRTPATTDPVTGQTQLTEGPSAGALRLTVIGALTALAFWIWNTCLKGGGTGFTIGKGVLGIKLVKEATGRPIGTGMAFLRQLAHFFDGLCYIGYLWRCGTRSGEPSRTRSWARSSSTFPSPGADAPSTSGRLAAGRPLVARLSGRSPVGRPGGGARCSSAAGLPRRRR
ncbi:MAG: RDD family protein [Nocardioides sp.]